VVEENSLSYPGTMQNLAGGRGSTCLPQDLPPPPSALSVAYTGRPSGAGRVAGPG
jgi:hypothetical protein